MRLFTFSLLIFLVSQTALADLPKVVLVPGCAGSMLRTDEQAAWIGFEDLVLSLINYKIGGSSHFQDYTDNTFRKYILGFYDGNGGLRPAFTNKTLTVPDSLDGKGPPGTNCFYNGKLGGLCGIEYLIDMPDSNNETYWSDFVAKLLKTSAVNYYGEMIEFLSKQGYLAGKTLFGFPYDWRFSARHEKTLERFDRLLKIASQDGQQRVTIISHSMGCLVTKLYFALYPKNAERYIGKWIAIGGPFQGAGGHTVEAMFSGYAFGNFAICNCAARQLAVQSPSAMELMTNKWFEDQVSRLSLRVTWPNGTEEFVGKKAIFGLAKQTYRNYAFAKDNQKYQWPFSTKAAEYANKTQEILMTFRSLPPSVQMYVVYGEGLATPYNVTYVLDHKPTSAEDLLCNKPCVENNCYDVLEHCNITYADIDGDGTVPTLSASHPFGDEKYEPKNLVKFPVPGVEHVALIKDWTHVFVAIQKWLSASE